MHETSPWLSTAGIAAAILAAIVFTIMAIRNRNMKIGVGKEGPFVETNKKDDAPAAVDNSISGVKIKARDVNGGIHVGHNNPGNK